MARNAPTIRALVLGSLLLLAGRATAVQPSETLLPDTTKGYAASPDIEELRAKFRKTQLGAMVQDEAMKPFIEDLREQLRAKLNAAGARLGLTWEDLQGVPAGEVAIAAIQPDPKEKEWSHATAVLVDITGKQAQADALLAKMEKNLLAQRAVKSRAEAAGSELTIYTLPEREVERLVGRSKAIVKVTDVVVHFIRDDQLVVTDHRGIAAGIAGRFGKQADDTLGNLPAFKQVMGRLAKEQGEQRPQARWFIEPFGYTEVSRAIAGGKRRRGTDLLNVLRKQGFTAIQGLGGHIFFATGDEEILHRTFVYAPPVPGKLNDDKSKWELAMRMLDFPNSKDLAPPQWVPQDVCTYVTFHNKLQNSFWYAETLVDEYMGDKGVFKDMVDNLRLDPAGPMIDLKRELIDHLGERVVVISDVAVPVTVKSERLIVAIQITNPEIVRKTLDKNFSADPKAKKRQIGEYSVWEVVNEEMAEPEALTIEGDDGGFVAARAQEEEEVVEDEPILPNMAFTVFEGQLMIATHVEFLAEVMENAAKNVPLDKLAEYEQVQKALVRLGAGEDSLRAFTRTDESYRGTYELLRQGKLPQGETILSRLLNNALGSSKKEVRRQEIDGSKMPDFEQVQKYLGPAGSYVHTEDDGWILVGCLLKK